MIGFDTRLVIFDISLGKVDAPFGLPLYVGFDEELTGQLNNNSGQLQKIEADEQIVLRRDFLFKHNLLQNFLDLLVLHLGQWLFCFLLGGPGKNSEFGDKSGFEFFKLRDQRIFSLKFIFVDRLL